MANSRKKIDLSPSLKLGVGRGQNSQIFKIGAIACLVLALGFAGYAFSLLIKESSSQDSAVPQVLGASSVKNSESQSHLIEYQVNQGDTLFNISQKYNITWTTLATLNNLKTPFTLKAGQILKIPQ